MSQYAIHQAFTQAVIDLALGIPLAYENSSFDPTTQNTLFADLTLMPTSSESMGKTFASSDNNLGIYQISLYEVAGVSVGNVLGKVDTIINYFNPTRVISAVGQDVNITRSYRNVGRNVNGWFVIDITIEYNSYATRV